MATNSFGSIATNRGCHDLHTRFTFFTKENQRLAVTFGPNGSGKTSLATALAIAANNPSDTEVFNLDDVTYQPTKDSIRSFSESYPYDNLLIKTDPNDALTSIALFNDDPNFARQIEKCSNRANFLENVQSATSAAENSLRGQIETQRSAIRKALQGTWRETHNKLRSTPGQTQIRNRFIDDIIADGAPNSEDVTTSRTNFDVDLQKYIEARDTSVTVSESILDGITTDPCATTITDTISWTPEPISTDELTSELRSSAASETYADAITQMLGDAPSSCPVCLQDISPTLLTKLTAAWSKLNDDSISKYRRKLESLRPEPLPEVDLAPFAGTSTVDHILGLNHSILKYNRAVEQVSSQITNKQNTPFVHAQFESFDIDHLGAEVVLQKQAALEQVRAWNRRQDTLDDIRSSLEDRALLLARDEVWPNSQEVLNLERRLEATQDVAQYVESLIHANALELREIEGRALGTTEAMHAINRDLSTVFFTSRRIQLATHDTGYQITSHGTPVPPSAISTGERNILALSHFFLSLYNWLQRRNRNGQAAQEYLAVIDDPISSLDSTNRLGLMSLLHLRCHRLLSKFDNVKIIIFTHDSQTFYDLGNNFSRVGDFNPHTTFVRLTMKDGVTSGDFSADFRKAAPDHEYERLMSTVYSYLRASTLEVPDEFDPAELAIGNITRRVVEQFASFIYCTGVAELADLMASTQGPERDCYSSAAFRLFLHGESHTVTAANLGNNPFSEQLSHDQRVVCVKAALGLLYRLQPDHVIRTLCSIPARGTRTGRQGDEEEVRRNLDQWCIDVEGLGSTAN